MFKMLSVAGVVILAASVAEARLLESWSHKRLMKEADLVVIARAKSTADADDRLKDNPWEATFLGQTTTLEVKAVLKGKAGDTIKVLHYKLEDGVQLINGPLLVTFRTKPLRVVTKEFKAELGAPEYLLFLKARKDGRYEPVSGRIDPALSVREMYQPDLFEK